MTREQLDAMRARFDLGFSLEYEQIDALLYEVERLTVEVEAKVAQNVALIGQNGRLHLEVERLKTLSESKS